MMVATYHSRRISPAARDLLAFWFGRVRNYSPAMRKRWFSHNPNYESKMRALFADVYHQAAAGEYVDWESHPDTCLALVILLDEAPRVLFRNTPRAFDTDRQAREVARRALDKGYDQDMLPIRRLFFYLPFEHSEDVDDQALSERLFQALAAEDPRMADLLEDARRHAEIIRRFGRFPHRNAILGRASTPDEVAALRLVAPHA